jgi:hypothetical protein
MKSGFAALPGVIELEPELAPELEPELEPHAAANSTSEGPTKKAISRFDFIFKGLSSAHAMASDPDGRCSD